MIRTIIYNRVSTKHQNVEGQLYSVKEYCTKNNWEIVGEYNDIISGTTKTDDRENYKKLIKRIKTYNDVDKVCIQELSRLSRTTIGVLESIKELDELGVSLHIKNMGLDTIINGKKNPMTDMMITILSQVYQMELQSIKERITYGIDRVRKSPDGEVKPWGRPKNSKETREKILSKHRDIISYLNRGLTIREINHLTSKSTTTINKVRKIIYS